MRILRASSARRLAGQVGEAEAAILVQPADSELIQKLLRLPSIRLMDFSLEADAYVNRFPSLSKVRLDRGAVEFEPLIPANDIAVNTVNQLVTAFFPPNIVPKIDLSRSGVPAQLQSAVVVPTLFGSVEAVTEALEHLEVQYLANRDAHLRFALLSDFTDSPTETRATDAAILAAAVGG